MRLNHLCPQQSDKSTQLERQFQFQGLVRKAIQAGKAFLQTHKSRMKKPVKAQSMASDRKQRSDKLRPLPQAQQESIESVLNAHAEIQRPTTHSAMD